jgi:hypothetical protein
MVKLYIGIFIIAFSGVFAWFGWHLASDGYKDWQSQKGSIYKVNFLATLFFKWPGQLFYVFNSPHGKTISPISMAIYIEVHNNKPIISRITGYNCRALFKYDKGGTFNVIETKNKSHKFKYNPSGIIVKKWRKLINMGFLGDQLYLLINNNWEKCRRIDCTHNSFDMQARNVQMKPGESIMGWIFLDIENDLRGQTPEIKEFELTLTNSHGDSQKFINKQKPSKGIRNFISSGMFHVTEGFYDFTKEKYNMIPFADLQNLKYWVIPGNKNLK